MTSYVEDDAAMAPEKQGRPTRRKGSTGRGKRQPLEHGSRKDSEQGQSMIIVDPWGAFLEQLLEQPVEGEAAAARGGKRK